MRSLSSSVLILVGMLATWAIPAHGQIVSYKDSDGKRVFINAEPVNVLRPARIPLLRTAANGLTPSTIQSSFAASLEMSAAEKANREKIEQMIREVSVRYRVGSGAGSSRDADGIELEFARRFPKRRAWLDATGSGNRAAVGRKQRV